MERYVALGFNDVKIKVGGASLELDVQRVSAARDVLGPHRRLALDANNGYRSLPEALRAARAFEPYDPWWFEEPLSPDNVAGHAELARTSTHRWPREIHQTRWDFRGLLESRAAAILQPDAGVLGGVSEWMKVAHTAATFDVPVAPHWHADLHVHLAAAASNCLTVEYFRLEEDIYNFEASCMNGFSPETDDCTPATAWPRSRAGSGGIEPLHAGLKGWGVFDQRIGCAIRHPSNRSLEDFQTYWATHHGPLFTHTPDLLRYVQHITLPEASQEPAPRRMTVCRCSGTPEWSRLPTRRSRPNSPTSFRRVIPTRMSGTSEPDATASQDR